MTMNADEFPSAVDPDLVGSYDALARAGGGLVWDDVLEYRVWCHPSEGGDDYYYAFEHLSDALVFADTDPEAERPLALVLQREWLDEPEAGQYQHQIGERVTEWQVEWLRRPRRTERTIPDFLSPNAPANRLDILRGEAS
ncbi:MAG: GCN5 family acetyltransferase [Pseudomonadota bacterium]